MSEFSVIVQGPINDVSLAHIHEYRQYGPVIMSCWESDPRIADIPDDVKLIASKLPEKVYYVGKPNDTFTYQVKSIYRGLAVCDTQYAVRTRSDEFYNLEPLLERFKQSPNKILCGNIFF